MGDSNTDDGTPEETTVVFDPDETQITFEETTRLVEHDLETLEDMGVLSTETEERDGQRVVTDATLHLEYLGLMATEFNTTERSLGGRFSRSRYRPDIRLRF